MEVKKFRSWEVRVSETKEKLCNVRHATSFYHNPLDFPYRKKLLQQTAINKEDVEEHQHHQRSIDAQLSESEFIPDPGPVRLGFMSFGRKSSPA